MVDFEPTKCFMRGLHEEFGTLKPWYDHIGGDAIGLTWSKPNSKVRTELQITFFKPTKKRDKSNQICNV